MSTAALNLLRQKYPQAQIDFLVRSDMVSIIQGHAHINRIIPFPRTNKLSTHLQFLRQLNNEKYDLIFDAHQSSRSKWMLLFLRAPLKLKIPRYRIKTILLVLFKINLFPKGSAFKNKTQQICEGLKALGFDGLADMQLSLSRQSQSEWQQCALSLGCTWPKPLGEKWIVLVPSASSALKMWPREYFKEMIAWLCQDAAVRIFVLGGPQDTFCQQFKPQNFKEGDPARVHILSGHLSMLGSAQCIEQCNLMIANDTGMLKVAEAFHKKTIAIFGPGTRELGSYPSDSQSIVAEVSDLWCRPCSRHGEGFCYRKQQYCLTQITPALIKIYVQQLLALNLQITLPQIGVAIITYNEAARIKACIQAAQKLTAQVVVVDSHSTDGTATLAQQLGVQVESINWFGYAAQKNNSLRLLPTEWKFSLDADEIITPQLAAELHQILPHLPAHITALSVKRKFMVGNQWIRFGSFYPDRQIRIVRKNGPMYLESILVHERIEAPQECTYHLKNALLHYSVNSPIEMEQKFQKYALLAAQQKFKKLSLKNYSPLMIKIIDFFYTVFSPHLIAWLFWWDRLVFKFGFLDGKIGWPYHVVYKKYTYTKYHQFRHLLRQSLSNLGSLDAP